MSKATNFKVTGEVSFSGQQTGESDDKQAVLLTITEERARELTEKLALKGTEAGFTYNPIKINDDGEFFFKTSSKYPVEIYDDRGNIDEDTTLDDIGKGSEVQLFVSIGEGKYKNKQYQTAYLKGVRVINLVPYEKFNPFADGADVNEI